MTFSYLETKILPKLISHKLLDSIEENVILLRETLHNTLLFEPDTEEVDLEEILSEVPRINSFVLEHSGSLEFYEKRKKNWKLPAIQLEILTQEPDIVFIEENNSNDSSFFHINMETGNPEILLQKNDKYKMASNYAHEYTHYTQANASLDMIYQFKDMTNDEKEETHSVFRCLREGQALKMEQMVSQMYSEEKLDLNYYSAIYSNILTSMTKVYNVLMKTKLENNTSKNKKSETNIFSFKPVENSEHLTDGNIGITYFIINNLQPAEFYKEFERRFL